MDTSRDNKPPQLAGACYFHSLSNSSKTHRRQDTVIKNGRSFERLVTRASNGCRTSFPTANSVFVLKALNLPGWHRGREYLRGQFWGRCFFLIYINDLPSQLERSCAIFADDTTVHAASSDSKLSCARISADLDVAAEWADSWGMLFSAEKSEHLHIGKATGQRVTMRGVPIPKVKHYRHLGLVMNNKLSWTEHSKDVHGTCSRVIGVLRRLRRRLQGTTVKAIFQVGAIRPRMEYASQVWSGGPTQSLQRLQDSFCKRHGIRLPPLQTRFDSHSLVLLYKMRSSLAPPYLCSLLPRQASAITYTI